MVLARAWRRRLYASLGLPVIVPVALLASLALLALNAGLPGLSALGQAFSGPSLPTVQPPVLAVSGAGPRAVAAQAGLGGGPAGAGRATARTSAGHPGPGGQVPSTGGGHPRGGSPGAGGRPGPGASAGGGGSSSSSPPPGGGGPPSHNPTVADRIVHALTPVTSRLPAPVGPAATGAAKSTAKTADRVLGHLPHP